MLSLLSPRDGKTRSSRRRDELYERSSRRRWDSNERCSVVHQRGERDKGGLKVRRGALRAPVRRRSVYLIYCTSVMKRGSLPDPGRLGQTFNSS